MKRRLIFLVLWLIVFDLLVPPAVRWLEHRRYEIGEPFRFENSDLFGLGPLVSYLREHPRGERRRVVFLGNSMMFGYFLRAAEAVPAQYEQQRPGTRAFNMAINGQELGTAYLVAKDVFDSVDVIFAQVIGDKANPMLPQLIPVDPADARAFELQIPDSFEDRLKRRVGSVWRLYGANERLQAALFGTSTRQYLYLHKRDIAYALLRPIYHPVPRDAAWPKPDALPSIVAPRAAGPIDRGNLARADRIMFDLAELARAHKKRVVFLHFEYQGRAPGDDLAHFNAAYAPWAERVVVMVPPSLTFDAQHLTAPGCRLVAEVIARHEEQAEKELPRRRDAAGSAAETAALQGPAGWPGGVPPPREVPR